MGTYSEVWEELLPNATITVDRFHGMQAVIKEGKARKTQEKKQHPEALKGAHYALLKKQEELTEAQQEALHRV